MRLRNAMLISALQQNATFVILFVTGVVIAHLLTPREVGSYAVAIAAANIFIALKDTAVGSYVISAPELDPALLRASSGLSLAITGSVSIGCLALSFALAEFYHDPVLGSALRIVAIAQLGPALAFPGTVRLTRAMRFDALMAIGIGAAIAQSLTSIVIAAGGHGAVALAWGYFAWSIATAVITIAYEPSTVLLRPALAGTRRLLAFGGWTSAMMIVSSTAMSAPELMIGRVSGTADVALFSRAQNLVSFIRNGLVFGIGRPLLPSLGQLEASGASVAPLYQRFVEIITGLAWPAYAVLAIWAEPVISTIYGEAWRITGTMMTPIAIAHALTLAVAAHNDVLIVKRRERTLFACEFASFIFTVAALAIGLTFGAQAAVWSLVASSAFSAVWFFWAIRSALDIAPQGLLQSWSRSLGLALVVIPVPMAIRVLVDHQPTAIMIGFIASCAISALIWAAAAIILRHELSSHLSGALQKVWHALRLAAVTRFSTATKESRRRYPSTKASDYVRQVAPRFEGTTQRTLDTREGEQRAHRLPSLDGLRAISIMLVLATHLLPLGPKALQLNSTAGPMGMSLFFTLSGFLILCTLRSSATLEFIAKRLARILPLAYLYILLVFAFFGMSGKALLFHVGFIVNYAQDQMLPVTAHLWSLCVEVHFYILVTMLVVLGGRRALLLVWPICAAITAIRIAGSVQIDVPTHLRMDEILAGACVATLPQYRFRSAVVSIMIWMLAVGGWALTSHPDSGWLQYLRPYAAGLLLWATISQPSSRLVTLLGSRPLRYIAATSYALYIIHPLTANGWWNAGTSWERYLLKRPLGFVFTLIAAHLSTFHWERFWIQMARSWTQSMRHTNRHAVGRPQNVAGT